MTTKEQFTFDEKKHIYYLDGRKMTGTTTVLGVIAKPALIQWAADKAAAYALTEEQVPGFLELYNNAQEMENWLDKKKAKAWLDREYPQFKEARTQHVAHRDKAAEQGTDVHGVIEELINQAIEGNNGYFPSNLKGFQPQVQHFIDWAIKHNVRFIASERKVYSEKLFVAGTYDFKCEYEGKIYIGDIKTTGGIFDRAPFAQCAAYQFFEEEMDGKSDVEGRLIINLKKTEKFDEKDDVYFSYDYEGDLGLFMAALTIYRTNNLATAT